MQTTYTQVPNSEIEGEGLSYPLAKPHRLWSPYSIITILSLLLNVALVVTGWFRWKEVGGSCGEVLYSPVNVGLEKSPTKFHSFYVQNKSVLDMSPSPEVDAAWEALYARAGIRLTKEEATKLPNNTWPIHGASEGYLGALYVFHELHCLDIIRQTLYASHYNITFDDSIIRYCLSGLRQSVMCSADTSVVVWKWSDAYHQAVERTDILHSCKNFTKIQDWVNSRSVNMESLDLTSRP